MTAEQLSQLLDELGKRLGPAGEHVFELAVRQQYIDGITRLAIHLVLLVVLSIVIWAGYRAHVRYVASHEDYRSGDDVTVGTVVAAIAGIALAFDILDFLVTLPTAAGQLLNPEYAALRDILSTMKP